MNVHPSFTAELAASRQAEIRRAAQLSRQASRLAERDERHRTPQQRPGWWQRLATRLAVHRSPVAGRV